MVCAFLPMCDCDGRARPRWGGYGALELFSTSGREMGRGWGAAGSSFPLALTNDECRSQHAEHPNHTAAHQDTATSLPGLGATPAVKCVRRELVLAFVIFPKWF